MVRRARCRPAVPRRGRGASRPISTGCSSDAGTGSQPRRDVLDQACRRSRARRAPGRRPAPTASRTPAATAPSLVGDEPDDDWLAGWLDVKATGPVDRDAGPWRRGGLPGLVPDRTGRRRGDGRDPGRVRRSWAGLSCLMVAPRARRRGLARALTLEGLGLAVDRGADRAFLQVEAANGRRARSTPARVRPRRHVPLPRAGAHGRSAGRGRGRAAQTGRVISLERALRRGLVTPGCGGTPGPGDRFAVLQPDWTGRSSPSTR